MATPTNHVDFLLQAANGDVPDDTPWSTFKFMLQMGRIDTATIDETQAMNLFRNIRRAIVEERKDGMRDASREHIAAVLALASREDLPNDIMSIWYSLKLCLSMGNSSLAIPDSADWLRSFTRFRRIIAGEEVEQDNPQLTPPPPGTGRPLSDSTYGSLGSENDSKDEGFVTVLLDTCDRYKSGRLSIPYIISDEHEKHLMLRNASRRCEVNSDEDGVVHVTCFSKHNPEPSIVQFEVVEDHLGEVDVIFSRKVLDADKKRSSSPAEHCRRRDHSRSAGSSAEYFEEEEKAASYAIGVAFQDPGVRNLDEKGIANLGYKTELALRAARKARRG